ncbi:hypothetical protein DFH07DRAFT_954237 [Mycena maculata]|uniref:Uncharacterized protein n=1 Tax=Mycena maculata TaxID=230809 RepID=A0AAD7NP54_9AGAR|nr:hypothetical protein DFH07DRAFT_954237 [Mycena maculata]
MSPARPHPSSSHSQHSAYPQPLDIKPPAEEETFPCCLCVGSSIAGLARMHDLPAGWREVGPAARVWYASGNGSSSGNKGGQGGGANEQGDQDDFLYTASAICTAWMAYKWCALVLPETWVDEIGGERIVFGVNGLVRGSTCAACPRPRAKAHDVLIQCTKGKCPKACHNSCAPAVALSARCPLPARRRALRPVPAPCSSAPCSPARLQPRARALLSRALPARSLPARPRALSPAPTPCSSAPSLLAPPPLARSPVPCSPAPCSPGPCSAPRPGPARPLAVCPPPPAPMPEITQTHMAGRCASLGRRPTVFEPGTESGLRACKPSCMAARGRSDRHRFDVHPTTSCGSGLVFAGKGERMHLLELPDHSFFMARPRDLACLPLLLMSLSLALEREQCGIGVAAG